MKKRILAALLALGCALLVFTGCGSKKDTTPKDYTQIITMPGKPRTMIII